MNPFNITPSVTPRDEFTNIFFNQINDYKVLDVAEEQSLVKSLSLNGKAHDYAREQLVLRNVRFAISVAKKYINLGMPLLDLINEACIGLCKACDTFDPSMGCRFLTHAVSHMRAQILEALEKYGRTINTTHEICTLSNKYRRLCDSLFNEDGRKPSAEEFADFAGISVKKAKQVIKSLTDVTSLDEPIPGYDDENLTLGDSVEGSRIDESSFDNDKVRDAIIAAITPVLSERDMKAVLAHFGLSNQTMTEVSMIYGVSYENLRKAVERAIIKLKKNQKVLNALMEYRIAA